MNAVYRDKEWLMEKYVGEQWSTTNMAKFCGVSHKTICRWLYKYGIPTRDSQSSQLTDPKRRQREVARQKVQDYLSMEKMTIKNADKPTLNWMEEK